MLICDDMSCLQEYDDQGCLTLHSESMHFPPGEPLSMNDQEHGAPCMHVYLSPDVLKLVEWVVDTATLSEEIVAHPLYTIISSSKPVV